MPKRMYSFLVWGLILPILAVPVFGMDLIPAIGFALVGFGSWSLGRYTPAFRIAAIASALMMVFTIGAPYLPTSVAEIPGIGFAVLLVQCLLGWTLLTAVATDCQAHDHPDIAGAARVRRVVYVVILLGLPAVLHFFPIPSHASPLILVLPMVVWVIAYAILVWTVQNAKIRLFP